MALLVGGLIAGTLLWELFEVILAYRDILLDWQVGPVGFDLGVVALSLMFNPGSLFGLIGGIILFRKL